MAHGVKLAVVYVGHYDEINELPPGELERACICTERGEVFIGVGDNWQLMFPGYITKNTVAQLNAVTPPNEGCLGYVKANHRLYFWDGSVWRQIRY